jgi:hypothetical protein
MKHLQYPHIHCSSGVLLVYIKICLANSIGGIVYEYCSTFWIRLELKPNNCCKLTFVQLTYCILAFDLYKTKWEVANVNVLSLVGSSLPIFS